MRAAEIWTYRDRRYGTVHEGPLSLGWEVEGDPISDNYTPDEISAEDLLAVWARTRNWDRGMWAQLLWIVEPAWEVAPFHGNGEDFLREFTWPVNSRGERVQWTRLPVQDKLWHPTGKGRRARSEKGGFLQEATGWKPAPLQDYVHVGNLLSAAGFGNLVGLGAGAAAPQ